MNVFNKKTFLWLWCILLGCLIVGCELASKEEAKPILTEAELVEAELQKRINTLRAQRLAQCKKEAYAQAAKLADSTLIARARGERIKLNDRPDKPIKPVLPDTLSTKDDIELKPLIE